MPVFRITFLLELWHLDSPDTADVPVLGYGEPGGATVLGVHD